MSTVPTPPLDRASLEVAEHRLQRAQLASDVDELDALIHPDLSFVGPDGAFATKQDDLDAHRSGAMRLTALDPEDLRVTVTDGVGVTVLTARLAGAVGGTPFAARMRYTRTWAPTADGWRIVAAQAAVVV